MPDWPDVVFIDGGAGQLNAVREVIAELNLPREVTFIGIAKGEERDAGREEFDIEGREAFMLPHRDPVLDHVQRLRDEAHRLAIGTHRARRKKDITKNPLDDIEGIGPARKRALLQRFGSAKAVSRAVLGRPRLGTRRFECARPADLRPFQWRKLTGRAPLPHSTQLPFDT